MGKNIWIKHLDDEFDDNHPGCMWGIFHALDYHHWHSHVKNILLHRKHQGRRYAKRNGSPKSRLNVHDSGEVEKLLDDGAIRFFADQSTSKSSSINKKSLKTRIKALITEQISKEEDRKRQGPGFHSRPPLRRTYSIHHLEPSDLGLDEICAEWKHPITFQNADNSDPAQMMADIKPASCSEKFGVCSAKDAVDCLEHNCFSENNTPSTIEKCDKAKESSVNQKLKQANQFHRNASLHQFKEYDDVLEIFKVNKELFLKIFQNTDDGIADCFHSLQASNTKSRLTKSGSFPSADLSRSRNFRSSKLDHKQNENWSFPKGDKLLAGTQATKLVASKILENLYTKFGPMMVDDRGGNKQETSFVTLGSKQELDKQGNKEALRVEEGKNEVDGDSLDTMLGRVPSGYSPSTSENNMAERWEESTMCKDVKDSSSSCLKTDGSIYDLSKGRQTHRRTASLNESLDRYAQLFEYSFSREAQMHHSKSLRLTNENENASGGHAPISFKRIHSLSHLDSCFSLGNESHGSNFSGMLSSTVLDRSGNVESQRQDEQLICFPINTKIHETPDAKEETGCLDSGPEIAYLASVKVGKNKAGIAKTDALSEEMNEPTVEESDFENECPVSVTESCFQEEVTSVADTPISAGLECKFNCHDEKESSLNSRNRSNTGFLECISGNPENLENINESVKNHRHMELYMNDDADLNYIRDILERSGFTGNGFLGTWNSFDQPIDPSVFDEVEACWPYEQECSQEDISACLHHQLLFDLVNEVLLQLYDRSFTYYPKVLSSSCRIHSTPTAHHVIEDVWARISRSLSLRPELDDSLDRIVAQDLAKDDGWMNLQLETECVALELEDLIFENLLEEVLCP